MVERMNTAVPSSPRRSPIGAVAAVTGIVLDLDIALNALLAGAPAAFAALGVLTATLLAAVLAARARAPRAAAAATFAGLEILVALSGYATGSLGDPAGLTLSAVGAPFFASLAIALALVVAVVAVGAGIGGRISVILAGVLCSYGVGAIAVAALGPDGGFSSALTVPTALPTMLHGAYLATLVLLPVGIIASLVAAVRRRAGRAAAPLVALGLAAAFQAALLEAAGAGFPSPLAFETGPARPSSAAAVALLAQYVPPNDAAPVQSTTSQQSSTIAAIPDGPGPATPSAAPTGTPPPIDRFENGIDAGRATLAKSDLDVTALAQTLPSDPAAVDRFVRDRIAFDVYPGVMRGALGTLLARAGDDDDRAALLAALLAAKNLPVRFVRAPLSDAEIAEISARAKSDRVDLGASPPSGTIPPVDAGIDPAAAAGLARRHTAAVIGTLGADLEQSRTLASNLLSVAAAAGKAPAADPSASWSKLLRTHTWVQVQTPGGTWSDLDPALARLEPGTHLGATPTPLAAFDPSETWHATVRLVEDDSTSTPKTLASASETVPNLAGRYVLARFVPVGAEDPQKFEAATAFRPEIAGALSAQGIALDANAFGAIRALRFEIEIDAPGGTQTTYRRTLSGPLPSDSLARAAQLSQQIALIVTPGAYNQTFMMSRWLGAVHAVRPQLALLAGSAVSSPIAADASLYPYPLAELAARDDVAALALSHGARLWRDRPGIYLERSQVVIGATTRRLARAFDIVEDGMSAVGTDALLANATRGVYVTHAETTLDSAAYRVGMIGIDRVSRSSGSSLVVLAASADRSKLGSVAPAATENLDETFAHGQLALAYPTEPTIDGRAAYGWWTLDANGNALGRLTGGGGQESEEYTITNVVPEKIMEAWDVNQITNNCLGDGATTGSCGGELCDTFASVPAEKALAAGASQLIFGGAITAKLGFFSTMLGKVAGEIATNATSGNLCQAGYEKVNGSQGLAF
jgi:hypothetical protein